VNIKWSPEARADIDRLGDFVAEHDSVLADEIERELSEAPKRLLHFPRRGTPLSGFEPREVREYRVGAYLLRYEVAGLDIVVLRFFHAREDRF
jgi:addiction module RelE/StbE family toxin